MANDTMYTVRLAVKTPSLAVQYRMLEADVTVTGSDPDHVLENAERQLVCSIARIANTMGEAPPEEIRIDLEQIYGESKVAEMYGDDLDED